MHGPVFDGAPRSHQGLRRYLAPEGSLTFLFWMATPVGVDLDRLEIEQIHEEF